MTQSIRQDYIEVLENSKNDKLFRDNFYYLCEETTPEEIKECFNKENINSKLTESIISYGLMGSARGNKIENAFTLLECAKKYKNSNLESEPYYYNSAINLAIQKGYFDFAEKLIKITLSLKHEKNSFLQNEKSENIENFVLSNILPQKPNNNDNNFTNYSIVENKYKKFWSAPLKHFSKNSEQLNFLLKQDIHINAIKYFIRLCVEEENVIPFITVVKSKYLEKLLQDEEFKSYINNDSYKNIKAEFRHLMDNAILERKLETTLPLKKNKPEGLKI